MKKTVKIALAILSLSTMTSLVQAATPGMYAGLGLGVSRINSEDKNLVPNPDANVNQSRSLGGLGGRVFAGYNINEYFGLETGFGRYAPSKYKATSSFMSQKMTLQYNMNAIDLVGKAYLPIAESGFNVYALAGAARVNSSQKLKYTSDNTAKNVDINKTTHKVRPIYGAGVSYDVTSKVTTNLEFTKINGNGKSSTVPNANMLTLNLAYHFG